MDGLKPCGTRAAYRRHLRHGEKACDACRTAQTQAVAAWASNRSKAVRNRHARETAAKAEDYRFLLETGCTHPEMIAHRMGYRSVEALQAFVRRNGLPWVGMREAA